MCTKKLCHIFMLTYFTSLSFLSFDAVIIIFSRCKQEVNCSGHVTICTNHVKLHIFNWDPLCFSIFAGRVLKHQSVRFLELYKWKPFLRSLLWPVGLNGLSKLGLIHETEQNEFLCKSFVKLFWRKFSDSWKCSYFQNVNWCESCVHLLLTTREWCVKRSFRQTDGTKFWCTAIILFYKFVCSVFCFFL